MSALMEGTRGLAGDGWYLLGDRFGATMLLAEGAIEVDWAAWAWVRDGDHVTRRTYGLEEGGALVVQCGRLHLCRPWVELSVAITPELLEALQLLERCCT